MEEVVDYTLNETPFINPKAMLALLDASGRVKATPRFGDTLRAGTFPEEKIATLSFGRIANRGEQGSFKF